jgi:hypothetical protein
MGSNAEAANTSPVEEQKSIDAVTPGVEPPKPKRFLNGWTKELEVLFAEWADKAACYRWMHDRTGRQCHTSDQRLIFPVIILSTVTGAANFAMSSISQDKTTQNYVQLGLGGISIFTGILTTIANRLGYASAAEAHRGAAVQWGKFNRLIIIELSLHPDERMEAFAFLKMFRIELDRLIEQSPPIPDNIIQRFIYEFKEMTDIKKPDITGDLEHTKVFSDSNTRLKKIAEEAALTLAHKKGILKQLVLDDLDMKVRRIVNDAINGPITPSDTSRSATPKNTTHASFTVISPNKAAVNLISTVATNTIPGMTAINPTNPLAPLQRTHIPPAGQGPASSTPAIASAKATATNIPGTAAESAAGSDSNV